MEMTVLPMMDPTAPALTESTPLTAGSVPTDGNNSAFAGLLATAALGMITPPDPEVNPQELVPTTTIRQNGVVQESAPGMILQLMPHNGQNEPPISAESLIDELPLSAAKTVAAAADPEIKQATADQAPLVSEPEPNRTPEDLQIALAAMAMAPLTGQQPRQPVALTTEGNGQQVQPAELLPTGPAVSALPETVRAGNSPQPQQESPKMPASAALTRTEPLRATGKELPALAPVAVHTNPDVPLEQKVVKPDVTRTVTAPQLEALQAPEPRKAAPVLPLNLAIEVTVAEQSPPLGAAAESGQFPGQNSQEQSTAPQQQMVQLSTQPAKDAQVAVASTQATALPISQESLLEQVREQMARREVNPDGNQVRLKLNPAELGELQINLHLDDQRLRVEILTENKAVKAALLENMDSLKDILARQHIAVERFDVGSGSNFGQFFREGNRPEEQPRPMPRFMQTNGFSAGSESGRTMAAWQPRSNALVDVRF